MSSFPPAVRVIRAVPVVSFILFVLLWTRRGLVPVVVSALMVLPVVWGNVSRGIRETDPRLLEQARALRFSRPKTVRLLLSGRVLVTKGSLTVSTLEPGDLFGAAALYNDSPDYATTLTAQGICRCLLLDQELLDRLLGEEALLRRNYLTYLTGRIRFLNARLGSLAVGDTEGRVVRYLLSSLSYGVVECSASGLARQLGISRASVYRAFQDLEQAGLIRREGRAILVPDPAALEGVRGSG